MAAYILQTHIYMQRGHAAYARAALHMLLPSCWLPQATPALSHQPGCGPSNLAPHHGLLGKYECRVPSSVSAGANYIICDESRSVL
eukprot:COSAG06_NODE_413_length_16040_cov_8.901386_16_plen_86_part_00